MLLRSSSSPILNSWLPHSKDSSLGSSPEPEFVAQIHKPCSVSLSSSKLRKNLVTLSRSKGSETKRSSFSNTLTGFSEDTEEERDYGGGGGGGGGVRRTMSLGLAEVAGCEMGTRESVGLLSVLVDGGGAGGGDGAKIGGGGGSDGGDSDRGNVSAEIHYKNMIEADPGNPLLLSNYAKFLKEVLGDLEKAEEYCGRALLVNPNDGNVLAMYGDLTWQLHKDAVRAESYFDQAVKASPDDCYVQASYAHFLWDSEEDEEDEEEEVKQEEGIDKTPTPAYKLVHGVPPSPPPLVVAA